MKHQELRNDKDVVKAAVYDKADAIKFAAAEKKSDRDIALTALQVVAKDGAPFNLAFFWSLTILPTLIGFFGSIAFPVTIRTASNMS